MITVDIDRVCDRFVITVSGHAGFAPEGQDVVCAGASTLAFSLLRAVRLMDEAGEISACRSNFSKGYAMLDFTVKEWALEKNAAVFEAFAEGFRMLEESYPECVRVG